MIGKIRKGRSFGGCIRYVTQKDDAEIIASEGVLLGTAEAVSYTHLVRLLSSIWVETSQQVSVTRKMEAGTIPLPVIIGVKATLKTLHPELTIIARWHCISISFDWERPI